MNFIKNKNFKLQTTRLGQNISKNKVTISRSSGAIKYKGGKPLKKNKLIKKINTKNIMKSHRFKNKKPVWRRKSQLWVKLFRSYIMSLNGFNRRFKAQDKNSWMDLLKYRRIRWYFKNKIATRKAVSVYFGTKNKKSFLRVQEKIRLHNRSLLRFLQVLDNRLDVFIVRLGWGRTIRLARRMVHFGAVIINGAVIRKPHQLVSQGDSIAINMYALKVFTTFKGLRRKSIIKYRMYKGQMRKKRLRLYGRWKKKKRYFSLSKKKRFYRVARSLRFRRTKFPWFKKKRYSQYALKSFKSVNFKRFFFLKNHISITNLFFFEKSKKFCYLVWLYNFHILFSVFQYYRKPWFENIKFFSVLSSTRYL